MEHLGRGPVAQGLAVSLDALEVEVGAEALPVLRLPAARGYPGFLRACSGEEARLPE
jgi:hypothetical protein